MDNQQPVNAEKTDTVQLRLEGRVQGVGFRAFVADLAQRMGLDGWVCNRFDGSVEILVSGAASKVDDFVRICVHESPTPSRVDHFYLRHVTPPQEPGFKRRPTY